MNTNVHISAPGLEMIKHFESCFLTAYRDGGGVWTIGWGHTGLQHRDGTVFKGRTITLAQAGQLLAYDMNQFEARIMALVKLGLAQYQIDALISFDFNSGGLTLPPKGLPSTLLRLVNAGKLQSAGEQLLRWVNDNGERVPGLVRRRLAEREMFSGRDWRKYAGKDWKKQVPKEFQHLLK